MGWAEDICANINNFGANLFGGSTNTYKNSQSGGTSVGANGQQQRGTGNVAGGFGGCVNLNPLGNVDLKANCSSSYGARSASIGSSAFHCGCDVGTAYGSPVYAIRNGTVTKVDRAGRSERGLYIIIKNDDATGYAAYLVEHLSEISTQVVTGYHVKQGELIGKTGKSGNAKAGPGRSCFHWELHSKYPTVYDEYGPGTSFNPLSVQYTNLNGNIVDADAAAGSDGSAADGSVGGDGTGTELVYDHIAETKQYFTKYNDDNKYKPVDAYQVVFKKWNGKSYDITDVCANVSYKDSALNVATSLSCTIVANKYDKYLKNLNPESGDLMTLTNIASGKTIFKGMILQVNKSGLTGVAEITAMDDGRKLTTNNIITQFQNQPCYEVISTAANKAGIKAISAPAFESTYTGQFTGQASSLVTTALDQITQENGVKYFARVINDTIVIKSYSENVITPYWKPTENVAAAPCFANASAYSRSEDASSVATKIIISQNENGANMNVAEATSKVMQARYGTMTQVISADSSESVNVDDKALYNLYYGENSEAVESFNVSVPGSDAIIAGCLIKMYIDGTAQKFWVEEVTHDYYPNHTCKITLKKYKEPLDIETLRALYGEATEEGAGAEEEETEEEEET